MANPNMPLGVDLDPDGFLLHPEQWNELIAIRMAESDGIAPLTEAHWGMILSLRRHYFKVGGIPALRHLCLENQLEPHCIPHLFKDQGRELWRIAGLPNPGVEARAYL